MHICIETKHTISGATKAYTCELLHHEPGFGILRYVIDREYDIAGLRLSPGDETIALYWEDRPYTLYAWYRKTAAAPAYYFNIADRIRLSPAAFVWRDLVVDILVDDRGIHVLDEHELPAGLDPVLGRYISEATARVLEQHKSIIVESSGLASPFL